MVTELQKLNDKVTQLSQKLGVDPTALLEEVSSNVATVIFY